MEIQLVIFELGEETFGVDIVHVENIVKMQNILKMPYAPDYVEGVTNLRGDLLPVINLEKRLGMQPGEATHATRMMTLMMGMEKIGVIVNSMSEVLKIDDQSIEAAPPMVRSLKKEYISGIAQIETRLVLILNLEKVFTVDETQPNLVEQV